MGVEYTHLFMVADLDWLPNAAVEGCLLSTLQAWSLVQPNHGRRVQIMEGIKTDPCSQMTDWLVELPITEGEQVSRIMGPSHYPGVKDRDRYIQRMHLVLGQDYKAFACEGYFYDGFMLRCSQCGAEPAEFLGHQLHSFTSGAIFSRRCSCGGEHRLVREGNWLVHHVPSVPGFVGLWCSALILDCGKDLPAFPATGPRTLPCFEFTQAITTAFGTRINQLGYYC